MVNSRGESCKTGLHSGEFLLDKADSGFPGTGLRVSSKVRTTRLVTLDRTLIIRKLGDLSLHQHQQLNAAMIEAFHLTQMDSRS